MPERSWSQPDASTQQNQTDRAFSDADAFRWTDSKMCRHSRLIWAPSFGHRKRCPRGVGCRNSIGPLLAGRLRSELASQLTPA
jgi:hypothetical protein